MPQRRAGLTLPGETPTAPRSRKSDKGRTSLEVRPFLSRMPVVGRRAALPRRDPELFSELFVTFVPGKVIRK